MNTTTTQEGSVVIRTVRTQYFKKERAVTTEKHKKRRRWKCVHELWQ